MSPKPDASNASSSSRQIPSQQELDSLYSEHRELMESIRILEEFIPEIEDPVGMHIALYDMFNDVESFREAGNNLVEAARRVSLGAHSDLTFFLYNNLELFAQLNPEAQNVYERLATVISRGEGDLGANTLHLDQRKIHQVDLIPEILLAHHLQRFHSISKAEYLDILHDLCWYSAKAPLAPRCVLYVLEDRAMPHRESAIEFLAHDSGVPYIDLRLVDPDPEMAALLPPDFLRHRGAFAFAHVAGEPLVAMLNPYNLQLREDVGRLINAPLHFYFCSADGYQLVLDAFGG
jgi:hypothetical protein